MIELPIEPHVGIGPIKLGAERSEVRKVLSGIGFSLLDTRNQLDYFCDNAIQVEFDANENVQFIGVCCHRAYHVTYRDISVFDIPAIELFSLIASHDESGFHEFNANEYEFPNQIVTLWEADEQYDRLGGEMRPVWGQVGLGNQRYLEAIRRIHAN